MTNEQLLEEAKRRYPVGTKFRSPCSSREFEVVGFHVVSTINAWCEVKGRGQNQAYLYFSGQWAELLEPAKAENKELFLL